MTYGSRCCSTFSGINLPRPALRCCSPSVGSTLRHVILGRLTLHVTVPCTRSVARPFGINSLRTYRQVRVRLAVLLRLCWDQLSATDLAVLLDRHGINSPHLSRCSVVQPAGGEQLSATWRTDSVARPFRYQLSTTYACPSFGSYLFAAFNSLTSISLAPFFHALTAFPTIFATFPPFSDLPHCHPCRLCHLAVFQYHRRQDHRP